MEKDKDGDKLLDWVENNNANIKSFPSTDATDSLYACYIGIWHKDQVTFYDLRSAIRDTIAKNPNLR